MSGMFSVLDRKERIALGVILGSSLQAMTGAATRALSNYRERWLLGWYGEMISETATIADQLRNPLVVLVPGMAALAGDETRDQDTGPR